MTRYTGQLNLSLLGGFFVLACGVIMLIFAFNLMKNKSAMAAKNLMYTSIFYISFIQIIFVLDKFLS